MSQEIALLVSASVSRDELLAALGSQISLGQQLLDQGQAEAAAIEGKARQVIVRAQTNVAELRLLKPALEDSSPSLVKYLSSVDCEQLDKRRGRLQEESKILAEIVAQFEKDNSPQHNGLALIKRSPLLVKEVSKFIPIEDIVDRRTLLGNVITTKLGQHRLDLERAEANWHNAVLLLCTAQLGRAWVDEVFRLLQIGLPAFSQSRLSIKRIDIQGDRIFTNKQVVVYGHKLAGQLGNLCSELQHNIELGLRILVLLEEVACCSLREQQYRKRSKELWQSLESDFCKLRALHANQLFQLPQEVIQTANQTIQKVRQALSSQLKQFKLVQSTSLDNSLLFVRLLAGKPSFKMACERALSLADVQGKFKLVRLLKLMRKNNELVLASPVEAAQILSQLVKRAGPRGSQLWSLTVGEYLRLKQYQKNEV